MPMSNWRCPVQRLSGAGREPRRASIRPRRRRAHELSAPGMRSGLRKLPGAARSGRDFLRPVGARALSTRRLSGIHSQRLLALVERGRSPAAHRHFLGQAWQPTADRSARHDWGSSFGRTVERASGGARSRRVRLPLRNVRRRPDRSARADSSRQQGPTRASGIRAVGSGADGRRRSGSRTAAGNGRVSRASGEATSRGERAPTAPAAYFRGYSSRSVQQASARASGSRYGVTTKSSTFVKPVHRLAPTAQVQPVRTKYLLSNISFGVGLVSLSTAAYLFLRQPGSERIAEGALPVTVVAGPSSVQATYGARF